MSNLEWNPLFLPASSAVVRGLRWPCRDTQHRVKCTPRPCNLWSAIFAVHLGQLFQRAAARRKTAPLLSVYSHSLSHSLSLSLSLSPDLFRDSRFKRTRDQQLRLLLRLAFDVFFFEAGRLASFTLVSQLEDPGFGAMDLLERGLKGSTCILWWRDVDRDESGVSVARVNPFASLTQFFWPGLDDQPRQYWIYANIDNELAHKSGLWIVSDKGKIQYLVIHAPSPSTWRW